MANNPINLAVRFFLELAALYAYGYWGWTQHTGFARYALAFGLPLVAATLWGGFRVPADHGKGLVAVPGWVRLILEAIFFGGAVWAFTAAGRPNWALVFAIIIVIHYAISYDRILLLLKNKPGI